MDINDIGSNLKRLRGLKGLTQDQLAAKAGVSRGIVQNLEVGRGNPTLETIAALAKTLAVSDSELLGINRAITPPPVHSSTLQGMQVIEMLNRFSRMEEKNSCLFLHLFLTMKGI